VKSLREEGVALSGLMAAWKSRGVPALAVFYGKQAVNAFQEIRANIRGLGRDSQKSFLRSNEETYRALTDLLVSQGRLPEAEQVLGMLKEEEFFQFVRRDGSGLAPSAARATLGPGEAALEAEYRALADRVTLAGRLRGDLLARRERTDEEERQLDGLEAQLATATDHFQKFLEQLEVKLRAGGAAGGRVGEVRDALGMQKTLRELGDGAVLLYTLVGEDGYRVMLFTPDTQQAYENPVTARDLAQRVLAFRAALQDPRSDPAPQARDLYDILVGPKLSHDLRQAGARTLMWSLDGVLRYLPVAALRDAEQKYLVETYRNVIFTPASRDRLKDPVAARWQGLGLGVSKGKEVLLSDVNRRMAFKALPGVPRELRSIINDKAAGQATASSGGLLEGKVLLDESFTKDALRLELRRQYPLVHIASHFMFRPGNETDSFLLLGGEGEQNERLTVAELKRVSFEGVDLLTLSACETAMSGEGANGVEVESFGVLAQRQGAEAVLATLWPVADASTPLLMREFYRLREASPEVTKAEALRLAQLALLKEKVAPSGAAEEVRGLDGMMRATANFSHPFYWAPFILIGNWK
jgi:CHAT domain-containing protein